MSDQIRAKFRVESINHIASNVPDEANGWKRGEIITVRLHPVTGYTSDDTDENKAFWRATPSGLIELGCINQEAADAFKLDGDYYVTFTPAPTST